MKKFFFYSILVFLIIVYIYSIVFDAIPVSPKIVLEGVGVLYCFKYITSNKYLLRREYKVIIAIILIIASWDIITSFLNGQSEYHLIKDKLPIIGSIFGAQFIYKYSRRYIKEPDTFLFIVVMTIMGESLLALSMKASPTLYSIVDSVLLFDYGSDEFDMFNLARIMGIGNAIYFGVLASCVMGVMTAVYLLVKEKSVIKRILLIVAWIVISATSFLTARWSLFPIALSALLFVISLTNHKLSYVLGIVLLFLVIGGVALSVLYTNVDSDSLKWATAFFVDRESSDHSADLVLEWWQTTGFELNTFFIGDARYTDPNYGYYKRVDIGFFREIFYGGIIGLFLIIYSHYLVLKFNFKYNTEKEFGKTLIFLMLGYLAAMAKGNISLMSPFILYLVFYTEGIFKKRSTVNI